MVVWRAEAVDRAVVHLQADEAAHAAVVVADQVDGEILDEELALGLQRLAVERVQHRVAGAVGGGAGALRGALAEIGGHAAERALVDLAFLGARERHAPVVELVDRGGRVAAEVFDRVLVAEPVGALDGVVHVPAPVVRPHVAERGGNAALRRDGVRAGREHLGDAGGLQARLGAADAGAQARAAGADDHDVERVVGDRIGLAAERGGAGALGAVQPSRCKPFFDNVRRSRCAARRRRRRARRRRRSRRWRSAPIRARDRGGSRG